MVETMESIIIPAFSTRALFIPLHSRGHVGHCTLTFKSRSIELEKLYKAHVHIKIVENVYFGYLSIIMGWSYFLAWSISYYPQVYQNWRRRSVVGLSFDYQLLNIIGHSCYCVFNTCMYWNTHIQVRAQALMSRYT
jgi:cystinosin